ncbi:MAG: hypothetical protein V5A44_05750 [Haloarculaceae archaeon]
MSMSALDSVEDAFHAAKRLLLPVTRGTWFRLAAVMLFVAGGGLSPTSFLNFAGLPGDGTQSPGDGPTGPGSAPDPGGLTPELTPLLVVFLVLFVLFLVALWLVWNLAGATMEFVFVESLGAEDVRLKEFFLGNLRPGARLFAFRTGLALLVLGGLGAGVLLVVFLAGGLSSTDPRGTLVLLLLFFGVPLALVVFFALGLVQGLTTTFVVPTMLAEDRGVLSAWRRFLGVCRTGWKELLVYLVVDWVLGIAIGLLTGALTLAMLVVLGIPALLLTVPIVVALGTNPVGATIVLVVWLAVGVLFFVGGLLIAVPVQTFRRYYSLFVLGDVDADLDVVPTTRAAIRTDGGDVDGDDEGDGGGGDGGSPSTGGSAGTPASGESGGDGGNGDPPGGESGEGDDGWNVER